MSETPALSFEGFDNSTDYRLLPDEERYYINDTGTGKTLNLSHTALIDTILSLYELHVDDFGYDLGCILAREPGG